MADMTRRWFLATPAAALLRARERVSSEVFLRSPAKGVAVMADAYYTQRSGGAMVSIEHRFSSSDTVDAAYYRYSKDYGRTWGPPVEKSTGEKRPEGMLRRHPRTAIVDPKTGRFIEFWIEGILPTDDPLEGMRQWNIYCRVDGAVHQVIHEGAGFDARHPMPGIYTGKNMLMLGDVASVPMAAKDGSILLPAIMTSLDADGNVYNPTGGYTYTDVVVLHGRWQGKRLAWKSSEPVKGDPERSTRGMDEPTLAALADGRLMMVMRGSNDKKPSLPGYKWVSFSSDGGFHWSTPKPWTYHNGEPFFSPSACSQLLRHSNGKLYWVGHITATNPRGNRPRYPVYAGEVNRHSGLLIRDSLALVDDRHPGDDEILMLYSLYAREDRQTHQIALHMTRLFAFKDGWMGDAMLYRISM
jgi:hypothetical protein